MCCLHIVHGADEGTTQLVTVRFQMHGEPRQLSSEQHKHWDTHPLFIFIYLSHNMEIAQISVLLIQWPKWQHTNIHLCLTQLEANTPYASVLFQSFSQHAILDKVQVKLHSWRFVCHTSWMLLRDRVKSCAIPDGDGGTSEATKLGQEAAFCGEVGCRGRKWHKGVKENNSSAAHIRNPKYLSCLSGGGGNERVKSRSEGNNNSFK